MISSYLSNRQLVYNPSSGPRLIHITSRAAQRSILGPDLWNVNCDGILREDMPERTFLFGYADDIAVVITARNTEEAQQKLRRVMLRTKTWLDSHGLDLAMHKTQLLLLRYLGIRLDPRLKFLNQIQYTSNKA